MILKVLKKQSFTFSSDIILNIILGFSCGFFLNETSTLVFDKLAIFHSISISNLGKTVRKITR